MFDSIILNKMELTTKDILGIKAGTTLSANLDSYSMCLSVKQMAYTAFLRHPRNDIERYSVSIDSSNNRIEITAIPKKEQ